MKKNAKVTTLIDGYNIINKWNNLIDLKDIDLEKAREDLIEELAEYKSLSGEDITVVFDAYNQDRVKETEFEKYGIKIVFTKRFQTADTYIERELSKKKTYHNVKVVTDDGAIQTQATTKGAIRVTAYELKNDISQLKNKIQRKKKLSFEKNLTSYPISEEMIGKLDELIKNLENNGK